MSGTPTPRPSPVTRFDARLGPGARSATGWTGRILARFDHAAVVDTAGVEPARITLLAPGRGLLPWALCWPGPWEALRPGAQVRLAGEGLWVEPGPFRRLEGPGVDLSAERLQGPGSVARLEGQLEAVTLPPRTRRLLGREAPPVDGDLGSRVVRVAGQRLAHLVGSLRDPARPEILAQAVERLVGLGPGETPTGDDLLVGLMAGALRLTPLGRVRPADRDRYRRVLARLDTGATTRTARYMLWEAAEGVFPEPLLRLCAALGDPEVGGEALQRAVDDVAAVGHQSGADWIAGALALA